MRVLLAKSAGFCYGVKRAVELAERTGDETGGCWMLGDLIHNTHVVEDLARRGVRKIEDPDAPAGRGHGGDPLPRGAEVRAGRGWRPGASGASTPPAPTCAASSGWWPRRRRRAGGR